MSFFVNIIYNLLKLLDKFLSKIFKKENFINHLFDKLYSNSVSEIEINKKLIKFWTPSNYSKWMIDHFLQKEKLVEKFILEIPDDENTIFWDIGANLGVFSIFCASNKEKTKIISFECSPSAVLAISKNISLNNFENRISIFQLGITDKKNCFLTLKEDRDSLGDQFNSLGKDFDFEDQEINNAKNEYKIFSNSVHDVLQNNALEVPDYIKLDVGSFELEVLEGFGDFLENPKIKSIVTEMKFGSKKVDKYIFDKEKLTEKSNKIYKILYKAGFKSQHLENNKKKEGWYLDVFFR
jgi:FkbM family methyltransferase